MTSRNLDPVLARQLKRLALPTELQGSAEWERFLDSINEHYVHMNDDRALLSRSIELSTQEMDGLRRRLEAQRDNSLSLIAGIGESLGRFASALADHTGGTPAARAELASAAQVELARRFQAMLDGAALSEDRGAEITGIRDNLMKLADQLVSLLTRTGERVSVRKELEVARAVQQLLIPAQAVIDHPPLRFAGHFQPAEECGGDWWTVAELPGGRSLVVVGDVTGHGVSSAIITGAAKAACELALHVTGGDLTPNVLLELMNATLYRMTRRQIMMTSVAAVFDPAKRVLTVANAGHPFPLLVRDHITHPILAEGPQLGDTPGARYDASQLELHAGDVMVSFTDGATECENDKGERFTERRLRTVIQRVAETGAKGACDALVEAIGAFCGNQPLVDDLTLVVASIE
jgi:sigma-B regulation protein RsbU (phosphoserine phosphatase)